MKGHHKVVASSYYGHHKNFTKVVWVIIMSSPWIIRVVKMLLPRVATVMKGCQMSQRFEIFLVRIGQFPENGQ